MERGPRRRKKLSPCRHPPGRLYCECRRSARGGGIPASLALPAPFHLPRAGPRRMVDHEPPRTARTKKLSVLMSELANPPKKLTNHALKGLLALVVDDQ